MEVQNCGPRIAISDGRQPKHFLAEAVEDAAEACVGVLIDHNVGEVVANGDAGWPGISHVLYPAQGMGIILQGILLIRQRFGAISSLRSGRLLRNSRLSCVY